MGEESKGIRSGVWLVGSSCFGRRRGGGLGCTRRLSSVSRTATPASTLPTVRDISILIEGNWSLEIYREYVAIKVSRELHHIGQSGLPNFWDLLNWEAELRRELGMPQQHELSWILVL